MDIIPAIEKCHYWINRYTGRNNRIWTGRVKVTNCFYCWRTGECEKCGKKIREKFESKRIINLKII